ncbi:MAG: metallophosphoesterase, partial [Elusimicrobia bacterium]|nr:metallophosphoesterase [Elusimicrobiota bacterium]
AGPQRRVEPALPDRSRVPQAGPQRRVEPALPDRSRVPQQENEERTKTVYQKAFGPLQYFFDYRGFRFIVADTSDHNMTAEELQWLEQVLKEASRKGLRIFVFTHVPPTQLIDWTRYSLLWGLIELEEAGFQPGSHEFTSLMEHFGVERVYVGHVHGFGVAQYRGVTYVLTAGGGSPLYPYKPVEQKIYNFVLAEVTPEGRLQEWVYFIDNIDGTGEIRRVPLSEFFPQRLPTHF